MSSGITINFGGQLPFLNANIQWFQQRIQSGTQDGSLTQAEQQVLNPELSQLQQTEQQDLQSGEVNYGQTQQLWQQASELNSDIYSLRHNALGTTLPQSQSGNPPQLITWQNWQNNRAVNVQASEGSAPGTAPGSGNEATPVFDPLLGFSNFASFNTPETYNSNVSDGSYSSNGSPISSGSYTSSGAYNFEATTPSSSGIETGIGPANTGSIFTPNYFNSLESSTSNSTQQTEQYVTNVNTSRYTNIVPGLVSDFAPFALGSLGMSPVLGGAVGVGLGFLL
jgi:hypothetical protein